MATQSYVTLTSMRDKVARGPFKWIPFGKLVLVLLSAVVAFGIFFCTKTENRIKLNTSTYSSKSNNFQTNKDGKP